MATKTSINTDEINHAMTIHDAVQRLGIRTHGNNYAYAIGRDEKTPSLRLHTHYAYDFGEQRGYDLIQLVREFQVTGFWEAVEWICREAGLPLPQQDPEAEKRYHARQSVSDIYEVVFQDALKQRDRAIKYLASRGIDGEFIEEKIEFGYLPPSYVMADSDAGKRAGLFDKYGRFLFADSHIFPVRRHGKIVSFYARAADPKSNFPHRFPATTDPKMRAGLFGLDACRSADYLFVTESPIDAITLQSRGHPTIAIRGTSGLTDEHAKLLQTTHCERVILCFDTDENQAGQAGALKSGKKLFRAGVDVEIMSLPLEDGATKADVNSYFANHTTEEFEGLPRRELIDVLVDHVGEATTPRSRLRRLTPVIELIATQPALAWRNYAKLVCSRLTDLDQRRVLRAINDHHQTATAEPETIKNFQPSLVAEAMIAEHKLISLAGTVFRYGEGVYSKWAPETIDQVITGILGTGTQARHLDNLHRFLASFAHKDHSDVNLPRFLNLKNCLLDVEAGERIEHSPAILSTIQAPVTYDPTATCPLWLKTLEEILPDAGLRQLLGQFFGYCLTPSVRFQKGLMLYGAGENGKSLVVDVLEALVGPDNRSVVEVEDLADKFRVTELDGKLVNLASEVSARAMVDDAKLKKVVTGDLMMGEKKNRDPYAFRPYAKWIVSGNSLPTTRDKSHGYFRRWLIVPFTRKFVGADRDNDLGRQIIAEELSGILNWALLGFQSLCAGDGFAIPDASKKALQTYVSDMNPVVRFIQDCVTASPDSNNTRLRDTFLLYQQWAQAEGIRKTVGKRTLQKNIETLCNIETKRRGGIIYLPGVVLNDMPE